MMDWRDRNVTLSECRRKSTVPRRLQCQVNNGHWASRKCKQKKLTSVTPVLSSWDRLLMTCTYARLYLFVLVSLQLKQFIHNTLLPNFTFQTKMRDKCKQQQREHGHFRSLRSHRVEIHSAYTRTLCPKWFGFPPDEDHFSILTHKRRLKPIMVGIVQIRSIVISSVFV